MLNLPLVGGHLGYLIDTRNRNFARDHQMIIHEETRLSNGLEVSDQNNFKTFPPRVLFGTKNIL
jgi:hypothetical protein